MTIYRHVILMMAIAMVVSMQSRRQMGLNLWKNYKLNEPHLTISHSNLSHSIQFLQRNQREWQANYQIADEMIYIQFKNGQRWLEVLGKSDSLILRGLEKGEKIVISSSFFDNQNSQLHFLNNEIIVNVKVPVSGEIIVSDFNGIRYRQKDNAFGSHFQNQKAKVQEQSHKKLLHLFQTYTINQTHLVFGKQMISKTISQLCVQQHKDLSFIGICYNIHDGKRHNPFYKIDIRYSALIIDRLFGIYPRLALFLFEELVGLIEDQIFYSDKEFIQIPEHISVVRGFIAAIKNSGEEYALKHRVKSVLNGLMNQMLLSDVNNLEQEINYRENKKMHPTLVKMLSLRWRSNSRKNALSSIYQESFTPDYFYNNANQHLDNCISKFAWLTSATAQFVLLIKAIGSQDDIDSLQQSTSLFKILQQVSLSDSHAKQGRYYSINEAEGVRVYADQVGYQSFLPFIYDLTNTFPQEFLKNITTNYGLSSINLNHQKISSKFDFRGNIHLYFNYKILFQSKRKLSITKNQRAISSIQDLIFKIRERVLQFSKNQKHFTSWTIEGQGIRERKSLSLLSLLFLGQRR